MGHQIFVVRTKTDLERSYPVIQELRPHLSFKEYLSIYEASQKSDGYQLVAIEESGKVLAVMGYRFLSDFVRGKHVYIDDLVSTGAARSKGLGLKLLKFAEGIAKESGCKFLRLCAALENERGIQFYEKNGWTKRAYAFSKTV